jgi:hypothetical protein
MERMLRSLILTLALLLLSSLNARVLIMRETGEIRDELPAILGVCLITIDPCFPGLTPHLSQKKGETQLYFLPLVPDVLAQPHLGNLNH